MKVLSLLVLLNFWSCSSHQNQSKEDIHLAQEGLLGTNWYQTSGEAKALYLQGYNFAKLSFDQALKRKTTKPKAVIVDVDETILDNSPFQAKLIERNTGYPSYWKEWIATENSKPLPGALEFLKYVESKGATVFYITNRKDIERTQTYNNLKKYGFPLKNESQLLVRTGKSDKSERRELVRKSHEIVLLVGDNLNDFDGIFEGKSAEEKNNLVEKMKDEFGPKYIILPNPLYGDWESAMYNYDYNRSDKAKHDLRIKALKSF